MRQESPGILGKPSKINILYMYKPPLKGTSRRVVAAVVVVVVVVVVGFVM